MAERQAVDELHRAYSTLGVPPTASPEQIRQRYLRLSQEWHPDKWMKDPVAQWRATEKMKRLNEAYALIKDAPLLTDRAARATGLDASESNGSSGVVVVTSHTLTSNVLIAGWAAIGLGLYALADSLLALFGVSLIRESGARLDDIRSLSRHTPSGAAFGWQSWIVSFGDAAERVLGLRALAGLIVAYTGLSVLRRRAWAPAVLAIVCVPAIVCGAIGLWALLRPGGGRHTGVPLDAILLAAGATWVLRLLIRDRRST